MSFKIPKVGRNSSNPEGSFMKKMIFITISGVIVLAFAFFGLTPSFFGGGAGRGVALSVNDEVVTTLSFNNIVRSASKRQSSVQGKSSKQRRKVKARLKQQLLNELVQLNVVYVSLSQAGFYIAPRSVIDQIVSTPAFLVKQQFRRTRYESLLKSVGQTPDSFESQIEKSLVYQRFSSWVGEATKVIDLEQSVKEGSLGLHVNLDFFELKKVNTKKKGLVKLFDKKISELRALLKSESSKSIKDWKKKNKLKLTKSDKVSLLSSYLPLLGQNRVAYKKILQTKPGNFVNSLIFNKGSYYLVYIKSIKKETTKNASFDMLNQWFARQRQQVAMQNWFQNYAKDLSIYRNQDLLKL